MAKPYLSIIIPAYNEANRLPLTLRDIDRRLSARAQAYEILVVNDGSGDNTAEVVRQMTPRIRNLKLIDNTENKGKGAVVRQGMLAARGTYRLFTDADNSTSIDQFDKMIPLLEQGCEVVIGSRALPASRLTPPQSWSRRIPGKIGNLLIQALLLPGIWDTQCGFKAFREDAAEAVFRRLRISRWGFDVEALALAKALGYRVREVPVVWVNDPFSHVRASAYLQVLLEVVKIRWWLWTKGYGQILSHQRTP